MAHFFAANGDMILRLVVALGLGMIIGAERFIMHKEAGIKTLIAVPLALPDLVRPVGIIHRRQKRLTPTATRFIELLQHAAAQDAKILALP